MNQKPLFNIQQPLFNKNPQQTYRIFETYSHHTPNRKVLGNES
jgi:hypothetical protein